MSVDELPLAPTSLAVFATSFSKTTLLRRITHLPGFNGSLPFYLETGYVTVNEESGAELFYYFAESERNPSDDPLILWLVGGPYCSGFEGLALDIGPLIFKVKAYDGTLPTLVSNPYAWTKISSIIFLDWPVGTGFSFSRSMVDYHTDEVQSTKQIYKFLVKGMAVVALLRHFGCICCWELASELKDLIPRFDAAGVKLIAVGVGTPDNAHILAERLPFPLDYLYADPDRKAYDALGFYHGLGRTFFNPASAKVFSRFSSLRKAATNYTISATPDDKSSVLQQGGMLVFKGKELLYARKDEGTGDHAPLEDVLNICCKVPVS